MNKHLEPVFKIILPELEKSKIDYWVYGGVSVAAYVGRFIRQNPDADVFVKDNDFERVKLILEDLCNKNNFNLKLSTSKETGRPKIEITDSDEILSVIPVYHENNVVLFRYEKKYGGDEKYSNQILEKVERNIADYRFFTPQNEYIKELFINHIIARLNKRGRPKYKIDAKAILNSEELAKLEWHIC